MTQINGARAPPPHSDTDAAPGSSLRTTTPARSLDRTRNDDEHRHFDEAERRLARSRRYRIAHPRAERRLAARMACIAGRAQSSATATRSRRLQHALAESEHWPAFGEAVQRAMRDYAIASVAIWQDAAELALRRQYRKRRVVARVGRANYGAA
ncbi:hypothetical protein L0Z38_29260, partial [Burkholderia multivorans]|nr:hypothetical protein [Burkholderia multivorans]